MTRVACAQLNVVFGDHQANSDKAVKTLRECKDKGADLVVFPECFLTGYCVSSLDQAKAIAVGTDALGALQSACDSLGLMAVVGFAERDGDKVFNSAALLEPGSPQRVYRKAHLPELGLDKFVDPGRCLQVFDTKLGKIGILICFDLRIPEAARTLALQGAELIVLPTNWPVGAFAGPAFMAAARAAENRVFVATCNRVGTENGFPFIGQSGIYSVTGTTLAKASEDHEDVIMADIDLAEARNKRTVIRPGEFETTVFESRHPELYGAITEPK